MTSSLHLTTVTIETLATKIPSFPELPVPLKDYLASKNMNANKVEVPQMLKVTPDGTLDAKNVTIPDESFSIDPNNNDRSSLFEYSAPPNIVKVKTLGLFLEHFFSSLHLFILWATPSLCRQPPIIAHCFRIAYSWQCCKRILVFLGRKRVIWHDWWVHFGVLGDPGLIFGHWGA